MSYELLSGIFPLAGSTFPLRQSGPGSKPGRTTGFFYGLAITPEAIQPQEWLPLILGDQQADSIDPQQTDLLLESLVEVYNRFVELRREGVLRFPYC
ncbi:MAG: UPF0149 family protein [Syntrophotaleaceae bacterium]